METIGLNQVLENICKNENEFIRGKNIELEREYFTENWDTIPMSELMQGRSFEEHFASYKVGARDASEEDLDNMTTLLREYFLFSYGHDMMFKKKIEADIFTMPLMTDFMYPKLSEAVHEKYNDISVMRENPNFESNIAGIERQVKVFEDMQSLLLLLYCHDFQFPKGWQGLFPKTSEEILETLKKSGITIGDFLHALIDYKCQTMKEILGEINDPRKRKKYLDQVEEVREEKHKETDTFAHVDLPVTYFYDHTMMDFMRRKPKSSILLTEDKPKVAQKLYIPGAKKDN